MTSIDDTTEHGAQGSEPTVLDQQQQQQPDVISVDQQAADSSLATQHVIPGPNEVVSARGMNQRSEEKGKGKEKEKATLKESDKAEGGAEEVRIRRIPGFNLPLNYYEPYIIAANEKHKYGHQRFFPSGLNPSDIFALRSSLPLLTLREHSMLTVMNQLTEKPHWEDKIFDPEIISKWKSEMTSAPCTPSFTQSMADYLIAELQHTAHWFKHNSQIPVFNVVVKSDTALPPSFREKLQAAIKPLEDVEEHLKDWHPGSDGKVLDLVHPSLFPLVYGRTRILESPHRVPILEAPSLIGAGVTIPVRPATEIAYTHTPTFTSDSISEGLINRTPYSNKFQWLPCEVALDKSSSKKASIRTYINNLHPVRYRDVYRLVEEVIDAALPMWDTCLQGVIDRVGSYPVKEARVGYNGMYVNDVVQPEPDVFEPGPLPPSEDAMEDGGVKEESSKGKEKEGEKIESGSDKGKGKGTEKEKEKEPEKKSRRTKIPPRIIVNIRKRFQHSGIQVIVKFANIELTPEKPRYDGGSWHLEGQLNESICASAIYYYSSHNITSSTLSFRQQSYTPSASLIAMPTGFLPAIYGAQDGHSGVQLLGDVSTPEGRLVVFPNILQHQVQPFELEDKTQRGWRKILAIFLVDPNTRVLSTRHVPPQRRDWWLEEMDVDSVCGLRDLPVEIRDEIFDQVDFPMGIKEAKRLREELMEERKNYEIRYDKSFNSVQFSLCEH